MHAGFRGNKGFTVVICSKVRGEEISPPRGTPRGKEGEMETVQQPAHDGAMEKCKSQHRELWFSRELLQFPDPFFGLAP